MRTSICDQLGMEYPVLAFSHCRDVVAAVTRAGGFGVLGATTLTPEQLDMELRWIDDEVRGKPYGVDVLVPESLAGMERGSGFNAGALAELIPEEHRRFLDSLLEKYGIEPMRPGTDEGADPSGARAEGMAAGLSGEGALRLIEVALTHPIRLVANALGAPPAEMLKAAHDVDVPVAALAGRREHAERHVAAGVDIVVAQGYEAGGHTGEIATMVLVPEIVDAVAPRPVLAAGGIARGRQMAAAMALGAQGVWTGSVWLTTEEAETHPVVKEKFLAATSSDTVRSRSITGKPARQLKSAWTGAWDGPDSPGPLPMPLQPLLVDYALHRIGRAAAAGAPGAVQLVNYFVGQVVGSLDAVRPARQVLREMIEEYVDTVAGLADGLR
ncbi:MAG: nitronate monooxygenase family protein [Actinomycetota bacterium]|jgi:NAD(P)H-dependent flavin oxidoreductase YrpB (nitropropane dioxygenase family)